MLLYHVMPAQWAQSVYHDGLCVYACAGPQRSIYLCTRSMLRWAIDHTYWRHAECQVCVWVVRVSRRHLRRMSRRGMWRCVVDIPPEGLVDGPDFTYCY